MNSSFKPRTQSHESPQGIQKTLLLALLPFWSPLIPPLGISCMKSYLARKNYAATILDANIEPQFKELWDLYFETLRRGIPSDRQGNFLNIGQEVLRNHAMAYLTRMNTGTSVETEPDPIYRVLIEKIIFNTFYTIPDNRVVEELDAIQHQFFTRLEQFLTTKMEHMKPDVFGISVYSGTLPASLFAFRHVKQHWPHITTIMGGGIFASDLAVDSPNFHAYVAATPFIDKIITGEGEQLLLAYLEDQLPLEKRIYSSADLPIPVMELDTAPLPDFSDLSTDFYPYMAAFTSRSCPFQCSFCSETILWGKYRKKQTGQVVSEMRQLNQRYQNRLFLMTDSLLNPIITDLAEQLTTTTAPELYWDGYLRVDTHTSDIDNAIRWRKGGLYRARLGIESGSQKVLDLMDKRISIDLIHETIGALAYAGIKTTTMWIIGHPGETENDFQLTLDLLTQLKDDIYEADCNPFWYYKTGQVNSDTWNTRDDSIPLYTPQELQYLLIQTYTLDKEPTREEKYRRLNRFTAHCKNLGIPNPYTLREIYDADIRWKKLHKNAVPSIVEFNGTSPLRDNFQTDRTLLQADNPLVNEKEFEF